jgi:AcrR family transcriptional regulator
VTGRQRTPLSRERIAVVALELLDEQGAGALGMRPLAARLGVQAPSLYHHVDGVDEVIRLMHDLVDREIDLSTLNDPDWRRGLVAYADSYRHAFLAHPAMMALVADQVLLTRIALGVFEALAGTLRRIGVPANLIGHYMGLLDNAVVGSVLNDFALSISLPPGVHIDEFPELAAVVSSGDLGRVNDGAFAASIELIVADLERLLSTDADSAADR